MIKILLLIINILLFNYNSVNVCEEVSNKVFVDRAIKSTNPNYNLMQIDDYYYDTAIQPLEYMENIIEEFLETSDDYNVVFDESELDSSKELVQCNYSSFKEYVYNSNLTTEQIKNTLKGIEQNKPYELQDTTGINNIVDINTGEFSINGIGPEMDFDKPDNPVDYPFLTVFTAGVGGNASDWSNNGTVDTGKF